MFDILNARQNPLKKTVSLPYSYGKDDRVFVLGGWDIKRSPAPSISPLSFSLGDPHSLTSPIKEMN
jgi:hypothetical protein